MAKNNFELKIIEKGHAEHLIMEKRLKLDDLENVSYIEISTLRSWDLLQSRVVGSHKIQPEELNKSVQEGLEDLAAATEVEIVRTKDGANSMNYYIDNEEKKRIYLITMIKKWSTIRCQMTTLEGETLLMYVCRTVSVACFTRTKVSVTNKSRQALGSVIFSSDRASLFKPKGSKMLEIISRFYDEGIEHVIVEIDSTRVGVVSATSIKFTKYIDVHEKALIVGAWIPIALHVAFTNLKKPKNYEPIPRREKEADRTLENTEAGETPGRPGPEEEKILETNLEDSSNSKAVEDAQD